MANLQNLDAANSPLRVGLVGTGYAARLRAEALQADPRCQLVAVAGQTSARTAEFSQKHGAVAVASWADLIRQVPLDLVVVSTINRDHGKIVRAALESGLHVVVEYPLALDAVEGGELVALANAQNRLLHVEHIELLGGVHQALKASLPSIGTVFYSRYVTTKPERPAPQRWTYQPDLFGFPFVGALSRLHRLIDLFGAVATVNCQARFWNPVGTGIPSPYYLACLCTTQLQFRSGVLAEVSYGKGETLWQTERKFEIHGEQGALILNGDQGTLVQADGNYPLEVGGRRGLFAKDTSLVLDHLLSGAPLYVSPVESLYTLKVANAAQRSAETGKVVEMRE